MVVAGGRTDITWTTATAAAAAAMMARMARVTVAAARARSAGWEARHVSAPLSIFERARSLLFQRARLPADARKNLAVITSSSGHNKNKYIFERAQQKQILRTISAKAGWP